MKIPVLPAFILLISSGLYWQYICYVSAVGEPWDADAYWTIWYPVSLVLSALAGFLLRSRWGLAGIIVTGAQLPVMWMNNGTGPLLMVGLIMLCGLSIPAGLVAMLVDRWATSRR